MNCSGAKGPEGLSWTRHVILAALLAYAEAMGGSDGPRQAAARMALSALGAVVS